VLGVVDDREDRRIEELRWGLVPHWAKQLNARFSMINARAETLRQKRAYRGLARQAQHRCLILARPRGRRRSRPPAAGATSLRADGRAPRQPDSELAAPRRARLPRRPRPRNRRS
jgi:SOS response associated peptidase (SRAP)